MQVKAFGHAQPFENLQPGTFFRCLREEPFYGLCITDGERKAALVFDHAPPNLTAPCIAVAGLPYDTLLVYDHPVLRVDHDSISADSGITNGAVITCNGGFYMRGSESMGWGRIINLDSGTTTNLPKDCRFATYSRWSVGVMVDEIFHPIFSFPPTPEAGA